MILTSILLMSGCLGAQENDAQETIVISDTAADALLMDVEGLEDLDDIDTLIEELTMLEDVEAEYLAELDLDADISNGTVLESDSSSTVDSQVEIVTPIPEPTSIHETTPIPEPTPEDVIELEVKTTKFMGSVKRINRERLVVEIVRVKKIDKGSLEGMSPNEKRQAISDNITHTGVEKTILVDDGTVISLQNGSEIRVLDIKVDQLVQIVADSYNNAKSIKLLRLLR